MTRHRSWSLLVVALALGSAGTLAARGPGSVHGPSVARLQAMVDEQDLIRLTNEIDVAVDQKDWARARDRFADHVRVDFTSLVGGEPATITAEQLVDGWRKNLVPEKRTLHLRGNHLVTVKGDQATVYSHGYAWNQLQGHGSDLWEVWGNYTHEAQRTAHGWRVTAMTFTMTYERGNALVRTWVPTTAGGN